jgi:hypothetical protein
VLEGNTRYGEELVNENVESFLQLCRGSDMIIMNGWFLLIKVNKKTFVQRTVALVMVVFTKNHFILTTHLFIQFSILFHQSHEKFLFVVIPDTKEDSDVPVTPDPEGNKHIFN